MKTHIKTEVICSLKSPTRTFIVFDKKSNGSLRPYVDYQDLNNPIIKNQYLLPLINKLLDWLDRAKKIT